MSYPMQFYGVFTENPININSRANLEDVLYRARQAVPQSLDETDLRERVHSPEKDMLHLRINVSLFADDLDSFEDEATEVGHYIHKALRRVLSYSNTDQTRGQRAFIIPNPQAIIDKVTDESFEIDVWIGRNVWYNRHRMTSGYPASDVEKEETAYDIADRLTRNLESYLLGEVTIDEVDITLVEKPSNIALTLKKISEQAQQMVQAGDNERVISYMRDNISYVQRMLDEH